MNLEATPEQEDLRATLRRFFAEAAPIAWVRSRHAVADAHDASLARGLVALGATGLLVPADAGGAGLGMLEMGVALEEHGRALCPSALLASALGATRLLVALRAGGASGECAQLLRALAAGERVATLALHELASRADWRASETCAVAAGDGYRLLGEKAPVPDAAAADVFLVAARDSRSGALGVYATEAGAAGVQVTQFDCADGTRKLGALRLEGAPARRLGSADAADALAAAADAMAVGLAADALGAAERALELAVAYAKQREQFGRPIGSFQAVQHLLVDMLEDVELTRAAVQFALWSCDHRASPERERAVALAKATASEALPRVCASAIQVHGGIGFTEESDLHLYYRRVCSMQLLYGDAAHHFEAVARSVVDARGAR